MRASRNDVRTAAGCGARQRNVPVGGATYGNWSKRSTPLASTRPATGPSRVAAAPATRRGVDSSARGESRANAAPSAKRSDIATRLRLASAVASGCVSVTVALPIGTVSAIGAGQPLHSTRGV